MQLKQGKGFAKKAGKALQKASPTILSCIGAVGVIATAVLTAKATPKAVEQIKAQSRREHNGDPYAASKLEMVKSCWVTYAPAAITGIATIGCILGANTLNRRQQASLISAYAFLDRSFRQYKQSVKNVFGEDGHKRVLEDMMVEKPQPPSISGTSCYMEGQFDFGETDDAKHLFYDAFSERYFEAKFSDVLLAELHTNRNFAIGGGEVSLHYFYDFLGLDTPEELKPLAWYVSDYYYFIDFTHEKIMVDDGLSHEPIECWVIEMPFPPTLEPLEEM